MSAQQWTKVDY